MRINVFLTIWIISTAPVPLTANTPDAQRLANRIDQHLSAKFKSEHVQLAPKADDAEFLRRAYLDITGRIPVPQEVHEFLADSSTDKRGCTIPVEINDLGVRDLCC